MSKEPGALHIPLLRPSRLKEAEPTPVRAKEGPSEVAFPVLAITLQPETAHDLDRPTPCRASRPMPGGALTMPRIIETVVYGIEELSETAKEKARSWYRQAGLHDDWHDFVFEDFETVCRIFGVTLRTSHVKLMGGGTWENLHILFQGFWSQGVIRRACWTPISGSTY